MLAILRLRSSASVNGQVRDTMKMLHLNKVNTLVLVPENKVVLGMIKKIDGYVAWGTASKETEEKMQGKKMMGLKPPKGGLKSIKYKYPRGDLGYNGDAINVLIKKMMW